MKRPLSVLLALLALSCAEAQYAYFGLRVDVVGPPNLSPVVPLPGFQLGGPVLDDVELRVSLHTFLLANFVQVDVLYTQNLSDALRGYGGVGGDVGGIAFYDDGSIFGVHATAGLEYGLGSGVGLFGEVQPLYVLHAPASLLSGDRIVAWAFSGSSTWASTFTFSPPSLSEEARCPRFTV
jgi:hypothetical protein